MFHVKRDRARIVPNTYAAKKAWAARWFQRWRCGNCSRSAVMGVLYVLERDGRDDVAEELTAAIVDEDRRRKRAEEGLGTE